MPGQQHLRSQRQGPGQFGQSGRAQPAQIAPGKPQRAVHRQPDAGYPGRHTVARRARIAPVRQTGVQQHAVHQGKRTDPRRPTRQPHSHAGGRTVADQIRILHHQGKPNLRPGVGRHARGQRGRRAVPVSRKNNPQPTRPGARIRVARQFLRRRRSERRRAQLEHGRVRQRLCGEKMAHFIRRPRRQLRL